MKKATVIFLHFFRVFNFSDFYLRDSLYILDIFEYSMDWSTFVPIFCNFISYKAKLNKKVIFFSFFIFRIFIL